MDDLLDTPFRDPNSAKKVSALKRLVPLIDPSRVRLIKISAEGMDSRVLSGLRRIIGMGQVPYVSFVYNNIHIKVCNAPQHPTFASMYMLPWPCRTGAAILRVWCLHCSTMGIGCIIRECISIARKSCRGSSRVSQAGRLSCCLLDPALNTDGRRHIAKRKIQRQLDFQTTSRFQNPNGTRFEHLRTQRMSKNSEKLIPAYNLCSVPSRLISSLIFP
jgi:hypothetical protein